MARGYTTLEKLKQRLRIVDAADDASLQAAIDAAEDMVDAFCRRRFDRSGAPTARRFTAIESTSVRIDDAVSVTSVAVDRDGDGQFEETLPASAWEPWPYNADARARPFERLVLRPGYTFPLGGGAVQVTAEWGWPSVPAAISAATEHEAEITFRTLVQAPFGVDDAALAGGGLTTRSRFLDGRTQALLRPFTRVDL